MDGQKPDLEPCDDRWRALREEMKGILGDEDEMIVHCVPPTSDEEAEAGEEGTAEPEVISKGKADEEESEEKE